MMSAFAQQPLQSPRGLNPHDFTRNIPDWEAAVFDSAVMFVVLYLRRSWRDRRFEFKTLAEAVAHEATQDDRGCIYAVTESGRFALLDRVKWAEWEERLRRAPARVKLIRRIA